MKNIVDESKSILKERIEYSILESSGGDHPLTKSCWEKLANVMSGSLDICMAVIDAATDEELEFITEVLDDVTDILVSEEFLSALEERKSKFEKIGCSITADINYAKQVLSKIT